MAIENPVQRVEYIRSMAHLASLSQKPDLQNAFSNIREDILLVRNPTVQKEATELLRQAIETVYWLELDPEKYSPALANGLNRLADYLKENDR